MAPIRVVLSQSFDFVMSLRGHQGVNKGSDLEDLVVFSLLVILAAVIQTR